jgi:hypothetical protein
MAIAYLASLFCRLLTKKQTYYASLNLYHPFIWLRGQIGLEWSGITLNKKAQLERLI